MTSPMSTDFVDLYDTTSVVDLNLTSSFNSSASPPDASGDDDNDVVVAVFKAIPIAIIMASAIGGNLLVIIAVIKNDRLRLLANTFLVSLAVADLLVALLVMPFNATMEIAGRWPFHRILCDVFNANDVMFSTASLLHLGCVSVDRYVAVTDPFGYDRRMTRRRVAIMLGCLWSVSAALAHLPIHLGWHLRYDGPSSPPFPDDECKFEVNRYYGVVSCAISFWLPALIMVFAYQRIYQAAQRQAKFIQSLSLSSDSSTDRLDCVASSSAGNGNGPHRTSVGAATNNQRQQRHERRKMRREHKAAKTLGVILGAFLCCWLPFFSFYLTVSLCGDACQPPAILVSILFWIGYLNSALNPLIYAAFNRDFRHSFRRTLGSCVPKFELFRSCCGGGGDYDGPLAAVFSSCCHHDRNCCCSRCRCSSRDVTPPPGGARTYDNRQVASEAHYMLRDDNADAAAADAPYKNAGVPGCRMVQSVTEETSLR